MLSPLTRTAAPGYCVEVSGGTSLLGRTGNSGGGATWAPLLTLQEMHSFTQTVVAFECERNS